MIRMKIPETSANGPYYGNDENGQWQGVMGDAGVSGVVGSGDGYHTHPPAFVPQQPGYVVSGYFPPGSMAPPHPTPNDFADYLWMENEEEFDKQIMKQLEEEALMEQCIEAMLEDERDRSRPTTNGHTDIPSNGVLNLSIEEQVSKSTLNPLAAEFVPTFARPSTESAKESTKEEIVPKEEPVTECPKSTPIEHPEVSAIDVIPLDNHEIRPEDKESHRPTNVQVQEAKRPVDQKTKPKSPSQIKAEPKPPSQIKTEPKPEVTIEPTPQSPKPEPAPQTQKPEPAPQSQKPEPKPQSQKSEPKIQSQVKPETKSSQVKSEILGKSSIEENETEIIVPVVEPVKVQQPVIEETLPTKPINYAAAAKAKVKKPQPVAATVPTKTLEKPTAKPTKPVQRKNSAK